MSLSSTEQRHNDSQVFPYPASRIIVYYFFYNLIQMYPFIHCSLMLLEHPCPPSLASAQLTVWKYSSFVTYQNLI